MVETFWQVVQDCISVVQRSMIPEKNCFWNSWFFFRCGHGLEFFESLPEIFCRISEKCNLRVHIYILRTSFLFFDTSLFFLVCGLRPRYFRTIRQNNLVFFVGNCIQLIQRNDLMKILSFKNLELFYHLRTLNEKSLAFLLKNFCTIVETILTCPGYTWTKTYIDRSAGFSRSFCILIDYYFVEFFWTALSKPPSLCQRYKLRQTLFWKNV